MPRWAIIPHLCQFFNGNVLCLFHCIRSMPLRRLSLSFLACTHSPAGSSLAVSPPLSISPSSPRHLSPLLHSSLSSTSLSDPPFLSLHSSPFLPPLASSLNLPLTSLSHHALSISLSSFSHSRLDLICPFPPWMSSFLLTIDISFSLTRLLALSLLLVSLLSLPSILASLLRILFALLTAPSPLLLASRCLCRHSLLLFLPFDAESVTLDLRGSSLFLLLFLCLFFH